MRWLPSIQVQAESATVLPSGSINNNNLTTDFQTITLEETIPGGGVMSGWDGLTDSSNRCQFPNGCDVAVNDTQIV